MSEKEININFDINAKCQSMIEEANKIIKVYLETTNLYEEDGRYNLAYDVKKYLPKLQQENKQLKENYKSIDKSMSELIEENQQLKQKYLNAVANYESEKSKNQRAMEYMKPRFMNCIDNDKRYFENYDIQEIYEILKGENNE